VYPVVFDPSSLESITSVREAVEALSKRGIVKDGDRVLITKGDFGGPGGTNAMKIVTVGQLP